MIDQTIELVNRISYSLQRRKIPDSSTEQAERSQSVQPKRSKMKMDFQHNVNGKRVIVVTFDLEFDGNAPIITGGNIHSNYGSGLPKHPPLFTIKGKQVQI